MERTKDALLNGVCFALTGPEDNAGDRPSDSPGAGPSDMPSLTYAELGELLKCREPFWRENSV